jgi:hypothetical protein
MKVPSCRKGLSHEGFKKRCEEFGYAYCAENVLYNYHTADNAGNLTVGQWEGSPPHKDNMLRDKYTKVGCDLLSNSVPCDSACPSITNSWPRLLKVYNSRKASRWVPCSPEHGMLFWIADFTAALLVGAFKMFPVGKPAMHRNKQVWDISYPQL